MKLNKIAQSVDLVYLKIAVPRERKGIVPWMFCSCKRQKTFICWRRANM